ncbi:Outer membrane protein beta-barrel domain-containing protein [Spirosomataceae bacterium TFI 002]|nr:Outer membrane protein beta-barrel domain-containing protein [Spirosomataceae bacterium TFI 002]
MSHYRPFLYRFLVLFALISIGFSVKVHAQRDLLITQAGEEIRCRILDETPTRFIYAYVDKRDKVLRNEIFKNLVTSFKYNFYDTDLVKSDKLPGNSKREGGKAERVDTRKESSKSSKKQKKADRAEKKEKLKEESSEEEVKVASKPEAEAVKKVEAPLNAEKSNPKADIKEEVEKPANEIEVVVSPEVAKNLTDEKPVEEPTKKELKKEERAAKKEKSIDELSKKDKRELDKEAKRLAKEAKKKESSIENAELLAAPEQENEFKNYLKFRVGVKGGISNIINNSLETNNAYDLYREKLNKGWTFGADAAYFITEGIGIGGMFTNFMSKNSAEGLTYPNLVSQVNVDNGSLSTNISNKFAGPVLYLRKAIDFKTFVVLGLSPGMNFYSEKGNYNGENFDFKAKQFGGAATLGLDFLLGNDIIGRDIILSLEAGYNYSRFNEMDYGSIRGLETLASPLVMDRLDFSIGLRFMRFPKYLKSNSF